MQCSSTGGSFCFGLDAPVTNVPAGYSLESIVYLGVGVNKAMVDWGAVLLRKYGTKRPVDYTTQHLGFSTDNGAYYYYGWQDKQSKKQSTPSPSAGYKDYQDAMEGVYEYSKAEGIPYKHILLDSWWYTKGDGGGLKEWDATNATFPDGLKAFADKTGWQFQMHNRYWSDNNVYAKQNGGKYDFMIDDSTQYAMPLVQTCGTMGSLCPSTSKTGSTLSGRVWQASANRQRSRDSGSCRWVPVQQSKTPTCSIAVRLPGTCSSR